MTPQDWLRVLEQAAELGVKEAQFIGGEPMLHRELPKLIAQTLELGLAVEVFSNLMFVPEQVWPLLRHKGVRLATSYYSDRAEEHEAITRNRGSYKRTKANVRRAVGYGIPLRAGIIHVNDEQRVREAAEELRELGVEHVGYDRVRALGRAAETTPGGNAAAELCGACTRGRMAVLPDGHLTGCGMAAQVGTAGSVREAALGELLRSEEWRQLAAKVPSPRGTSRGCSPETYGGCVPDYDSCTPASTDDRGGCYPDNCNPNNDTCEPSSTPGVLPVVAAGQGRA